MSAVSDIYAAYLTEIASVLTDYSRIPNGLDILGGGGLFLAKGYAVIPTDGINTERFVDCQASFVRNYTITLVQQMTATENNTTAMDDIYKDILEDALLVQKQVEKSTILNNSSTGLGVSKFTDDSGLFFLSGEREKYIQLNMNFETEYFVAL